MGVIQQKTIAVLVLFLTAISGFHLNAQSFVTNGSASAQGGNCYQLTPDVGGQAGSIFSQNTINLNEPFSLDASFFFGCKDVNGADGIVFILATTNTALGVGGGGLGYLGITPSFAVEYDDYFNSNYSDPTSDHMAIISMGAVEHNLPTNLVGPVNLPNIEDCMTHCFAVGWDPLTMTLTASLDGNIISYTGNIIADIFSGNAQVYYGFSSGTGSLSNLHRVCFGPPTLAPMPDVSVCAETGITLQADPNGIAWTWAPHPTLSSLNISNPIATPSVTTTYTTTIEYPCGYLNYDTVVVTVIPPPTVTATNSGPVCAGQSLTLMADGGTSYQWSGPMSYTSASQNPVINSIGAGMAGLYTVTVTDVAGCTAVTSTMVIVDTGPDIDIDMPPSPLCENEDPVQLSATPSGGIWSGDISPSGIFDPDYAGEGMHVITYTVTGGNGCTNSEQVTINVVPNIPAEIMPTGPFCYADQVVTLTANPPGGIWGGTANSDGEIYPNSLFPGMFLVTYTLAGQNECYSASIFIEIVLDETVYCPDLPPVCFNSAPVQLTAFPPGGTWSGGVSPTGIADPMSLGPGHHQVFYSYSSGTCLPNSCWTILTVYGAPNTQNLEVTCDGTGSYYTVAFDIAGGDPATYAVTGSVNGAITPGNPASFLSDPIPSGNSYQFQIFDNHYCDTVTVSGSYSCNCPTQAGTMDMNPFSVCEDDTIHVLAPTGVILDLNDTLVYVLHTGDPHNFLVSGNGNEFVFGPPLQTGIPYFISVLAGNTITGTGVDLNDPCLAITHGPTVIWHANPSGYLVAPSMICLGDSASLSFLLNGDGPFNILYSEGSSIYALDSIPSGQSVVVHPANTTSYSLLAITDRSGPGCTIMLDTSLSIAVSDVIHAQQMLLMCKGDSIFLAGSFQSIPGMYYDTIPGGIGCDTVVESFLTVLDPDTTIVFETTCDSSDAGSFETLLTNQLGCDSVVITNIQYEPPAVQHVYESRCASFGDTLVISVFTAQNGCDSLVYLHLDLWPEDTVYVSQGDCDISAVGTFSQTLVNQFGCDSLVITDIFLLPADSFFLTSSSCLPADTGFFTTLFQNIHGCDSTIFERVDWLPADSTYMHLTTCEEAETGIIILNLINGSGCDSTVWLTTSLLPDDSCIVVSHEFFIPNVFSPNGDGYNDLFYISSSPESVAKIPLLRIYDRWGGLVFERKDVLPNTDLHGWDGTGKGKPLGPGVFVWSLVVEYVDGQMESFVGDVTLIR